MARLRNWLPLSACRMQPVTSPRRATALRTASTASFAVIRSEHISGRRSSRERSNFTNVCAELIPHQLSCHLGIESQLTLMHGEAFSPLPDA